MSATVHAFLEDFSFDISGRPGGVCPGGRRSSPPALLPWLELFALFDSKDAGVLDERDLATGLQLIGMGKSASLKSASALFSSLRGEVRHIDIDMLIRVDFSWTVVLAPPS
jgi:hypothetical protein